MKLTELSSLLVAQGALLAAVLASGVGQREAESAGAVSVTDPEVRRRCADEEQFLRQISSLPPEAAPMSWWFALALGEARARRVRLGLHVGGAPLRHQREADSLGRLLVEVVERCPAASSLDATLVRYQDAARLLLLGDIAESVDLAVKHPELGVTREAMPARTLVEASWLAEEKEPLAA